MVLELSENHGNDQVQWGYVVGDRADCHHEAESAKCDAEPAEKACRSLSHSDQAFLIEVRENLSAVLVLPHELGFFQEVDDCGSYAKEDHC